MHPSAERINELYERHAHDYAADRSGMPFYEKSWLDRFVMLLPASGAVLDLGCGCAVPMARYLIECGRQVAGVDASPTLVSICRDRFPDQEWRVEDMRGLDLGRRFAGVLAWDSFFHLPEHAQRAMFAVFERHAVPGCALMFTSGPEHGEAVGEYRGEPLYHASLSPDVYRELLGAHGFEMLDFRAEDPDCGRHTVWLARRRVE